MNRTRVHNAFFATVSIIAALLITGCGVSKEDYEREMRAALAPAAEQWETLYLQPDVPTTKQYAELEASLNKAAKNVAKVTPPDDAAEAHDELAQALLEVADAAGNGDRKAGLAAIASLVQAQKALSDAGYVIFSEDAPELPEPGEEDEDAPPLPPTPLPTG